MRNARSRKSSVLKPIFYCRLRGLYVSLSYINLHPRAISIGIRQGRIQPLILGWGGTKTNTVEVGVVMTFLFILAKKKHPP